MKFITSDNVRIEYDFYGEDIPTATPITDCVVILSGIGGTRVIWQPQIKALIHAGYKVLNIDARNQGSSEHTVKGTSMARHALDVQELIKFLNIRKPYLMGNSMGAATCLAYVSLFSDAEISGIINVDQSPKMINDKNWHYGYKKLTWLNFNSEIKEPLGKTTVQRLPEELFKQVDAAKKSHPYDEQLNFPLLVDHSLHDWRPIVKRLSHPMLLVSGAGSPLFNSDFVDEVSNLSKQVEIHVVKGSGHLVMAEQSAEFNNLMLAFLTKLKN